MPFIDSHCHLDFPALAKDGPEILQRARAAGVAKILTICTTMADFPKVLEIAEQNPDVYCSIGIHPHEAEQEGEIITTAELIELSKHPKIVGFGETGLDYFYDHAPRDAQIRNFREHIRAAIATGLPLIVHTRDAEEDTAKILNEERAGQDKPLTGVLHCFSSRRALAEQALAMGFFISFSGMITFKKSAELRAIAKDIPLDRLLIETDAPFLAPEPYRGKVCEPAHVVETAKCLAEIKGVGFDEIGKITTENFYRLYQKVPRS